MKICVTSTKKIMKKVIFSVFSIFCFTLQFFFLSNNSMILALPVSDRNSNNLSSTITRLLLQALFRRLIRKEFDLKLYENVIVRAKVRGFDSPRTTQKMIPNSLSLCRVFFSFFFLGGQSRWHIVVT